MGQAVHDATGRVCCLCGLKFKKTSFNMSKAYKVDNLIVYIKVCKECYLGKTKEKN